MYGNLQTTPGGAKKILIAAQLAEKFSSGADYMDGIFNSNSIYVILTDRIAYDKSGSSGCTRAQYKGHQVYLDDSLDADTGFNFIELEEGIQFDGSDSEKAGYLTHLSDHSFLRLGMVYEATTFIGSTDRIEGWYIQSQDYEGAWQASLNPESKGDVIVGVHREDTDYPFNDGVEISVQGVQLELNENTENPLVSFLNPQTVTPPDGEGYIYYTTTVTLGFDNQSTIESEIDAGNEIPEDVFEDTTEQAAGSDPTGEFIYTFSEPVAYYIKKNGEICNLVQLAANGSFARALSSPLDLNKLGEDINVASTVYEAGCYLSSGTGTGTGTDTVTFYIDAVGMAAAGDYITAIAGTCTHSGIDVDRTALAIDMAGDCLTAGTGTEVGQLNVAMIGGNDISVNGCTIAYTGTNTSTLTEGCGINIALGVISVDLTDFDGAGLVVTTGGACDELAVGAGCGITVNADDIEVKLSDFDGNGLQVNVGTGTACDTLEVDPDCFITVGANGVSVDVATMAGAGLTVSGTGTCQPMAIGAGCGITVAANAVSVDRTALIGDGLSADSGTCDIKVGTKRSIEIDTGELQLSGDVAVVDTYNYYGTSGSGVRGFQSLDGRATDSINFDTSTGAFELVNDELSPGNNEFYGTGNTGTKGFFNMSTLAGTGIAFAGNNFDLDFNSLTAATLNSDDYIAFYDVGGSTHRKFNFAAIDGYTAGNQQVLTHNTSGVLTWIDTTAC